MQVYVHISPHDLSAYILAAQNAQVLYTNCRSDNVLSKKKGNAVHWLIHDCSKSSNNCPERCRHERLCSTQIWWRLAHQLNTGGIHKSWANGPAEKSQLVVGEGFCVLVQSGE